ncbi:unnamed protein product [Paramecium pentaurelia]|uniref:DBF4-type domain-containing protein n=1 Tax=Paramecium pentaurelia TaxID=43138 RepID=A0A8S1TD75_9CILI|nr:unnamed protein product [Paramecium pentaurelia]
MIHSLKPKKRCQQICYEHQFILIPKSSECWIKSQITLDYCPVYNEFTGQFENIIPILNCDRQPGLPTFILEYDRTQYQFNLERYQQEHQLKIEEQRIKKTKMLVPKPGKKHRYCGVCKKNYEEYLDHIQSQEHINNFNTYRSVNLIRTLIQGFQNVINHEFSDQKQSSILFCDSNTKIPMNKENFVAYFDQERIGIRFQKQQIQDIPMLEYKIPSSKRGRPNRNKQKKEIIKKAKVQEDIPIIPHYQPNTYLDYYYLQQQYLQAQQQIQNQQQQYLCYPQPQQQYFRDQMQYCNQNAQLDLQFYQSLMQQQQHFLQLKETEERREYSDRSSLWQKLIQLTNYQQPTQNEIVQLLHTIIEQYECNPRNNQNQNLNHNNNDQQFQ